MGNSRGLFRAPTWPAGICFDPITLSKMMAVLEMMGREDINQIPRPLDQLQTVKPEASIRQRKYRPRAGIDSPRSLLPYWRFLAIAFVALLQVLTLNNHFIPQTSVTNVCATKGHKKHNAPQKNRYAFCAVLRLISGLLRLHRITRRCPH